MKSMLINYVLFQAGWLACVWGAAHDRPWLGLPVVAAAAGAHLLAARNPGREACLLLVCMLLGMIFDSGLMLTGWLEYPNGYWLAGFAPYWIIALWVVFGTTLNRSLRWMHGRPWLAFVFGAAGGPLSYAAGESLGAMSLLQPLPALAALAVGWGLILPVLFTAAARLDGFVSPPARGRVQVTWHETGTGHA